MPKKFSEVVMSWYKKFQTMKPGSAYEIKTCAPNNPDAFVDMAKCFMDFEGGGETHEFSSNYEFFKRVR